MKQSLVVKIESDDNSHKIKSDELEEFLGKHFFGVIEVSESRAVEFEQFAKSVLDSWSIGNMTSKKAMGLLMDKFQELYG